MIGKRVGAEIVMRSQRGRYAVSCTAYLFPVLFDFGESADPFLIGIGARCRAVGAAKHERRAISSSEKRKLTSSTPNQLQALAATGYRQQNSFRCTQ